MTTHRPDPEPFDAPDDGPDDGPPPVEGRWTRFEVLALALLAGAAAATWTGLALIPSGADDPPPAAPVARHSTFDRRPSAVAETDWSAYDPASGLDPALLVRPVAEAPIEGGPEPPLAAIPRTIPSRVEAPR